VHGTARASFRTWCAEQTSIAHEIAEAALAHKVPDAVVRAYRRTDFYERRAALMQQWATYCMQPPKAMQGAKGLSRSGRDDPASFD
jgi:hypothetical protein